MDEFVQNIDIGLAFIVCIASFIGSVSAALSGFGLGIIFQCIWSFGALLIPGMGNSLTRPVVILSIMSPINSLRLIKPSFESARPRVDLVLAILFTSMPMVYFAVTALVTFNQDIIKRVLGCVFLVFAVFQLSRRLWIWYSEKDTEDVDSGMTEMKHGQSDLPLTRSQHVCMIISSPELWFALAAGAAAGVMEGLFSTGGPPLIVFFTILELDKSVTRSTFVALNIPLQMNLITAMIYHKLYTKSDIYLYLLSCLSMLLGSNVGTKLHHKVNGDQVLLVLQTLLILATLPLTSALDGSITGTVILYVYFVFFGSLLLGFVLIYRIKRSRLHVQYSKVADSMSIAKDELSTNEIELSAHETPIDDMQNQKLHYTV